MAEAVASFHRDHPLAAGMGREELRGRLPSGGRTARLFQRLLAAAAERGELVLEGDAVRLRQHVAAAGAAGGALRERLAAVLAAAGLTPPSLADLPDAHRDAGRGREGPPQAPGRRADGRCASRPSSTSTPPPSPGLQERLVAFLREHQAITTQEFKDLVGATRKHVIPLAEHFDREKVTLRVGEQRVLRGERKA